MGFFNSFKNVFGGGHHHNHNKNSMHRNIHGNMSIGHHHGHSRHHRDFREDELVRAGKGVYAWIEKSGMFFFWRYSWCNRYYESKIKGFF